MLLNIVPVKSIIKIGHGCMARFLPSGYVPKHLPVVLHLGSFQICLYLYTLSMSCFISNFCTRLIYLYRVQTTAN